MRLIKKVRSNHEVVQITQTTCTVLGDALAGVASCRCCLWYLLKLVDQTPNDFLFFLERVHSHWRWGPLSYRTRTWQNVFWRGGQASSCLIQNNREQADVTIQTKWKVLLWARYWNFLFCINVLTERILVKWGLFTAIFVHAKTELNDLWQSYVFSPGFETRIWLVQMSTFMLKCLLCCGGCYCSISYWGVARRQRQWSQRSRALKQPTAFSFLFFQHRSNVICACHTLTWTVGRSDVQDAPSAPRKMWKYWWLLIRQCMNSTRMG